MTIRLCLLGHMRSLLFISLLLLSTGWLASCASPAPSATTNTASPSVAGSFVGKVTSTDAYIGLVSDGKKALAYICDGTPAGAKLLNWFKGPVSGNQASLLTETKDHLVATLTPTDATGTITLADGRTLTFKA